MGCADPRILLKSIYPEWRCHLEAVDANAVNVEYKVKQVLIHAPVRALLTLRAMLVLSADPAWSIKATNKYDNA